LKFIKSGGFNLKASLSQAWIKRMPIGCLMREAGPEDWFVQCRAAACRQSASAPRGGGDGLHAILFEPDDVKAQVTPVRWLQAVRASGP
jgi:hypothetical protein